MRYGRTPETASNKVAITSARLWPSKSCVENMEVSQMLDYRQTEDGMLSRTITPSTRSRTWSSSSSAMAKSADGFDNVAIEQNA